MLLKDTTTNTYQNSKNGVNTTTTATAKVEPEAAVEQINTDAAAAAITMC